MMTKHKTIAERELEHAALILENGHALRAMGRIGRALAHLSTSVDANRGAVTGELGALYKRAYALEAQIAKVS